METLSRKLTADVKWLSTAASIWIQCTSGSLYTFSIYSQALKSSQSYDQSTLDTVSVFKDVGANSGVISGLLYSHVVAPDHLPSSFSGPWLVLLAGAIQCFVGYILMWATVVGLISRLPVPFMCLFILLAAHAQTFFNTANVVTAVRNFPCYSGTAVGIMKGFLGLSGAILIQIYHTILRNDPTAYLLMLACLPTANTLILMRFVKISCTNQTNERKHLNLLSLVALIIAAYLMVVLILEQAFTFHSIVRIVTFVVLLLLLVSPLCIAVKAQETEFHDVLERPFCEGDRLMNDPRDDDQEMDIGDENMNLLQAIWTQNFWILLFTMSCGMGSGLATVNNMSQIGESLGYSAFETNTLVSLWSIWNFLGRFGAGYISDYFLHSRGWARPLFMVITLAVMGIGYLVIASGWPGGFYAGSILVGVCYGSQWSLMPTIASEIFGVFHMGSIFNAITVANPVGSYIFSVRVIGYIYDKETSGDGNSCTGTHCFMLSFLIMAICVVLGSLSAFALFLRTKVLYRRLIFRRLLYSVRD